MRSLFIRTEASEERMVVGTQPDVDLKEVTYIRDSKARLKELHHLCKRYKGTPDEIKIKAVYEKTQTIHDYLEGKKRGYELEIFHLQNTDHFINTFTVILDVFQQQENIAATTYRQGKSLSLPEKSRIFKNKHNQEEYRKIEMVKTVHQPGPPSTPGVPEPRVPQLTVPDISIDTSAKLLYYKEDPTGNLISKELGYTSSDLEKEGFLQYVSTCLGIRNIAYMGNALLSIPNSNGSQPTGLVPIIHWEGFLYALNLNNFRLFPVKISRK
ncbi:hypothetical protein [Adhaeribacter radiodurans]|uniref:Uncharacterized protein n=1 Tax=Adhaeribacter radiodurans TaxID=2745197 RepID=A0A7L7L969_9BACT|nr:hypothetical protein [Adhaeribacter radiodurans]QMU29293.1 hypothetical protein HUW48_15175 [Adhaeribacter radiodurans]